MWDFSDETSWASDPVGTSFKLSQFGGQPIQGTELLPIDRLVQVRLHPATDGTQVCPAAVADARFPGDFEFCPHCAIKLERPDFSRNAAWRPPYGSAESTRLSEATLGSATDLHAQASEQLPLPFATGRLRLLVTKLGAASRMLFALDLCEGGVAVYAPHSKNRWCELRSPLGDAHLPDWSWTVALSASERYMAVPDNKGLHLIEVDWNQRKVLVHATYAGRCLAGPGVLSEEAPGKPPLPTDVLCAPMMAAHGEAVLLWWREDKAGAWSAVALPAEIPLDEVFGQPVRPRRRLLVWPGRLGVLSVEMDSTNALPLVAWRPWPATPGRVVRGLPELGPCWRDNTNTLWQVCEERGGGRRGDDITIKRLRIDKPAESFNLPFGGILSTGYASFSRFHDHWRTPDEHVDTEPDRASIRMPLLQFRTNTGAGSGPGLTVVAHLTFADDVDTIDLSETLTQPHGVRGQMALEISGPNTSPTWLSLPGGDDRWSTDSAAFGKTDACLYDDFFWAYLARPDRLFRWPISTRSN